jgi:hypothetical protein
MKSPWIVRALVALGLAAIAAWFITSTHWVEVEEPLPMRGAALADRYYALRKIVAATGTPLEIRGSLEPLPPVTTTLVLDTAAWDLFPERDTRLKGWVEAGGHLVVVGPMLRPDQLHWIPLDFRQPPRTRKPAASAARPAGAASRPLLPKNEDDDDADDEDDEDDATDAKARAPARAASTPAAAPAIAPASAAAGDHRHCEFFEEPDDATPAFEPGRRFLACIYSGPLRPLRTVPTWGLANEKGTLALRVPLGRGEVTGLSSWLPLNSRQLIAGDNALVLAAVLDLPSRRPLWLVENEEGEPLPAWIWRHARAPLLLALAAIALALWRLMVRFGPREAVLAQARRSMGEQVRGTGEFIAARDPHALHAATRDALDEAANSRIEGYAGLDEGERVTAIAAFTRLDKAGLREALRPGSSATSHQVLAAIATLEQARRALLHAVPPRP